MANLSGILPVWARVRGWWVQNPRSPKLPNSLFQFLIYSLYFLVLFIICLVGAVLDGWRYCRRGRHQPLPLAQELRSPLENSEQVLSVQDGGLRGLRPSAPPLPSEDGVEDSVADLRVEAKA